MDKNASQSADFYTFLAWFEANRKRVITICIVLLAVAAIIGGYFWYQSAHEAAANNALSKLDQPLSSETIAPPAEPYLKLADEYSGTSAGARALLIGGSYQFSGGKFADAQGTFGNFMAHYPDSPLTTEAQLGVAASLEAQGKNKEAISRYEDLLRRHGTEAATSQAKSALARLYAAENRPDMAMQQYQELMKANNNDTWTAEAGIQLHELIVKHPELVRPAPAPATSSATNVPALSIPPLK